MKIYIIELNPMINSLSLTVFGRLLSSGLSFAIFLYLVRLVPTHVFGQYSLHLAYSAIVTLFGYTIIKKSIVRLGIPDRNILKHLYTIALYLSLTLTLFSGVTYYLTSNNTVVYVLILAISLGMFDIIQEINLSFSRQLVFNCNLASRSVIMLIMLIAFPIERLTVSSIITLVSLSYFLVASINLFYYRSLFSKKIQLDKVILIVKFGLPLAMSTSMVYVVDFFDRIYIGQMLNDSAVGIYSGIYTLSQQSVGVIMVAVYSYFWPKIVTNYSSEAHNLQKHHIRYYTLMGFIGVCIVIFSAGFHKVIITSFLGEEFVENSNIFLIVSASIVLSCIKAYCVDIHLLLMNKTKLVFLISIFNALMNIVLNILLIESYGVIGAAYSTFITFLVSFCLTCLLVKREYLKGRKNDNYINNNL